MPRLHLFSFAAGAVLTLTCGAVAGNEVPNDFVLTASFYPGGGGDPGRGPHPWQLTISRDGKVVQTTSVFGADTPTRVRSVVKAASVSRDALRRVVVAIDKADFFALPKTLSTTTYDHFASVVVKVTMSGRTREVEFLAPNHTYDAAALRRFWAVWRALLKAVPSPNKNEEMLFWIKKKRPDLAKRSNGSMPFRQAQGPELAEGQRTVGRSAF